MRGDRVARRHAGEGRRAQRRPSPPSRWKIAHHHQELLLLLGIDIRLATVACWACGALYQTLGLERAHIDAYSKGGSNHPSNYFLLCSLCHREQPDGADKAFQVAWLVSRREGVDLDVAQEFKRHAGVELLDFFRQLQDARGSRAPIELIGRLVHEARRDRVAQSRGSMRANFIERLVLEAKRVTQAKDLDPA